MMTSLLEAVPLPLVLIGEDQRVVAVNAAAVAMFGEITPGRHLLTVLRQPAVLDAVEAVLRDGLPADVTYRVPGQSREGFFSARCAPVTGDHGARVLITFEDRSDFEQVGAIRRDFVANVSHELRTPLTALLGFIETLRGAARNDAVVRARFLEIMQREAERMNRLVSDLMSLSRVEAEERVRPTDPADVVALARSSIAVLRPMAAEADVAITLSGADAPLTVRADPDQLTQVIQNLIENAIKYGASGGKVDVVLSVLDHLAVLRGPAVRIDVIDYGEGIDPLHVPRLTERFYRVDTHRSREKGGTGLGLAIVKHIVIRHRGRLLVHSEPGVGSRFSVVLPRD